MKLRTILITFLCLAAMRLAAADLTKMLPEDSLAVVTLQDTAFLADLPKHPLVAAIATPEIKKALSPLLSKYEVLSEEAKKEWEQESGLTVEETRKLFSGGAAVAYQLPEKAIVGLLQDGLSEPGKGIPEGMDLIIVVEFSGTEAMVDKVLHGIWGKALAGKKDDAEPAMKAEEYNGVTLHLMGKDQAMTGGWALADGILMLSLMEGGLRETVDRVKKGGASLADSPEYRTVVSQFTDATFRMYAKASGFTRAILERAKDSSPDEKVSPSMVIQTLGIDQIEALYVAGNMTDHGANLEVGVTFKNKPLVFELMAIDGLGKAPDFIPTNVDSAAYGTLHWNRILPAVEKMLGGISPEIGAMLTAQLDQLKKTTGVDIGKDLLDNIGPEMWSATSPITLKSAIGKAPKKPAACDDDESDPGLQPMEMQLFAVKLRDAKAVELALQSLVNSFAPGAAVFAERDYQGYTIKTIKGSLVPIGYVKTDEWLILSIGEQSLLEQVLTRLKKGGGDSVFSLPHVEDALKALPPDADGVGFSDLGSMLRDLVTMFRQLPSSGELDDILDLDALPENVNIPLILASGQYMEDHVLRVRFHISEKTK